MATVELQSERVSHTMLIHRFVVQSRMACLISLHRTGLLPPNSKISIYKNKYRQSERLVTHFLPASSMNKGRSASYRTVLSIYPFHFLLFLYCPWQDNYFVALTVERLVCWRLWPVFRFSRRRKSPSTPLEAKFGFGFQLSRSF